jgi:hypothetical protein
MLIPRLWIWKRIIVASAIAVQAFMLHITPFLATAGITLSCIKSADSVGTRYSVVVHELSSADATCQSQLGWPLQSPEILSEFDLPAQTWLAGHRGVDLIVHGGELLLAPESGTISFAGKVAGKDVVSIQGVRWLHSFEPAVTSYGVGTTITRSSAFAEVRGSSDHCDSLCVHWGVRDAAKQYRDSVKMTRRSKIVLKAL